MLLQSNKLKCVIFLFIMLMKKSFLIAILLFFCASIMAQAPKYSNEFLSIGVGARALGMSNAHVTSVNDVTSGYWNPAGLVHIKKDFQVGLMHAEYFAGIAKYDYGAFASKIDSSSAFAFSVIRFGVDDIPNTTELIDANGNINYDRIKSFSTADYAFLLSYARKAKIKGLNYGGNVKVIYRHVGEFANAIGFGIDAGAQYYYKGWQFGAMARDVTSTFNAWSYSLSTDVIEVFEATNNEIPENALEITLPKLILGAAKSIKISEKFNILSEANFDMSFDGKRNVLIKGDPLSIDPHLGIELGYNDLIFVRGGIGNFQEVTDVYLNEEFSYQINFGLGVKFRGVAIDYALSDIGDQSVALYSNIFSLRFDINKQTKTKTRFE